jgi:ribosomal protein S27AE
MAIEAVTRTVGYRLRCGRCGRTSPQAGTPGDALGRAEGAGWEVNSVWDERADDLCPRCVEARERELAERHGAW